MPVPVCWSTAPLQYTSALAHPFEHPEGTGLTTGLVNYAPRKPILTQIQDLSEKRFIDQVQESRNLLVSGQTVTQVMNQGLATPKAPPSMGLGTQENSEAVLPGIETLLNAIQVVEGESPATDNEAPCFTKITALNAPDSVKSRLVCVLYLMVKKKERPPQFFPNKMTAGLKPFFFKDQYLHILKIGNI